MNQYQVPILPEYKSMYVDMGLSEIATIERDRYDKASAENDQLTRTMGSIRLLNGDKQVIKDAEDRVRTMIGSSDKFQLLGKNVSAAVTDFATDHRILNAMDSKAVADKEDEYANQLRAKGVEVPFQMAPKVDITTGQVVRDQNGNVVMVKASDVHNTETQGIYGTKVQERLDYDQKILQLLSGIAEDGYSTIKEGLLGKGLTTADVGTWVRTGGSGVSQEKKDKIADLLVDEFLLSPEGNQLYNVKTKLEVNSKDMLKSDKEARAEIQKHIRDLGQKQVGWKENAQQQIVAVPEVEVERPPSDLPAIEDMYKPSISGIELKLQDEDRNNLYDKNGEYLPNGPLGSKPGFKNYLNERANQLSAEITKAGGIGNINISDYRTADILRYIHTNPTLRAAFPKKPGQTEEQRGQEVLNAHRATVKVYNRLPENMSAMAGLLRSTITSSPVKSKDGALYASLEKFFDNENNLGLVAYDNTDATIITGLMESLDATSNGTPNKPTISAELVTGGNPELVGLTKVKWIADGEPYEIYTSPTANSEQYFAASRQIARAQKAKAVGETLLKIGPNSRVFIRTSVVPSKLNPTQRTFAVDLVERDLSGRVVGQKAAGQVIQDDVNNFVRVVNSSTSNSVKPYMSIKPTNAVDMYK